MARKFEVITELYRRTQKRVTAPTEWQRFLRCACYNFRLSFDEQLLLYAQRPDATAVLPIDGKNGWNERFGRWVNRGAVASQLTYFAPDFLQVRGAVSVVGKHMELIDEQPGAFPCLGVPGDP